MKELWFFIRYETKKGCAVVPHPVDISTDQKGQIFGPFNCRAALEFYLESIGAKPRGFSSIAMHGDDHPYDDEGWVRGEQDPTTGHYPELFGIWRLVVAGKGLL